MRGIVVVLALAPLAACFPFSHDQPADPLSGCMGKPISTCIGILGKPKIETSEPPDRKIYIWSNTESENNCTIRMSADSKGIVDNYIWLGSPAGCSIVVH